MSADGGTDDEDNLVTRCYDCAQGRPLEHLSERRRQFEMLLEWRRTWKDFKDDSRSLIIDYVNAKIGPDKYLNKTGEKDVASALKLNSIDVVLDTIDEVFDNCIKYDSDDNITKDSAEKFIKNIGRYLYVKSLPPVEQHLYLMRGGCRKIFSYWDDHKGMQILRDYVAALRAWNWSEDEILNDLKNETMPKINQCKNWTEFKNFIQGWTKSVREQINEGNQGESVHRNSLPQSKIEEFPFHDACQAFDIIDLMVYIYRGFPEYDDFKGIKFRIEILNAINSYLSDLSGRYLAERDVPSYSDDEILQYESSIDYEQYFSFDEWEDSGALSFGSRVFVSESLFSELFVKAVSQFTYHKFAYDFATGAKMVLCAKREIEEKINASKKELIAFEDPNEGA